MTTRRSVLLALAAPLGARAQFRGMLDRLGKGKGEAKEKAAAAIREALSAGATKAVETASRPNGFIGNVPIKITLPEQLRPVETALWFAGSRDLLDDLVLEMNKAAQEVALQAKDVLLAAIQRLPLPDPIAIVRGGGTAATDWLRKSAAGNVAASLGPLVAEALQQDGASQTYQSIQQRFPPTAKLDFSLPSYVTARTVEGLLYLTGEEEKNIRQNAAARVTPLLQEVFGKK